MASVQAQALETDATGPVIEPRKPLQSRIVLWARLWAFKIFVKVALGISRTFNLRNMGALKPTYTKRYPVGARLENQVWLPSSYKSGSVLPLYIDIHGGGFALGDPQTDAAYCNYLAEKHGICVVSINYRKAPLHPFPHQTQDLVEIVQEVLKDSDLPVDMSKVAMGGFSAGGNLSLSAGLRDELKGKLKGLVLWYPVTDFSGVYKGEYRHATDGSPDLLAKTSALFNYGYVPPNQDRRDPYLSPIYGDRSKLPGKLLFIGAEYDVLCNEAEKTAEMYAEAEGGERKGSENEWVAGGVTWKKVLDVQHGFNFVQKPNPEVEAKRKIAVDESYALVAKWLKEEIYA